MQDFYHIQINDAIPSSLTYASDSTHSFSNETNDTLITLVNHEMTFASQLRARNVHRVLFGTMPIVSEVCQLLRCWS